MGISTTKGQGTRRRRVLGLFYWRTPNLDEGISAYVSESDWVLKTFTVTDAVETELVEKLGQLQFDGILAQFHREGPVLDFCLAAGVPVVDMAAAQPQVDVPRVLLDEVAIGRMAAAHFVERGFRHFAFCSAYDHYALEDRLRGFREVAGPAAETFHLLEVRPRYEDESRMFARELARLPRPLAVMALDDQTAVLVVHGVEDAGLLVPEQVSVVSCNGDIRICEYGDVKISSVVPGFHAQGREAARLLDRLMDGETPPAGPIRIRPEALAIRQTSDMIAVKHIAAARAVRYIIQLCERPDLPVEDIVRVSGVSRRRLEVLFREHLGSGIAEYVHHRRIEAAKDLLINTDRRVGDVAARCGFNNFSHFSARFRKATGLSPSAWRKEHRPKP